MPGNKENHHFTHKGIIPERY